MGFFDKLMGLEDENSKRIKTLDLYRISLDRTIVRTNTKYIENGEIIFSFDYRYVYIWKKDGKIDLEKPDIKIELGTLIRISIFLSDKI